MSSPYAGNPANVTTASGVTINGATNASPIVIATAAAHGFQSSDRVHVTGVGGNTAANSPQSRPWSIAVVDSTHFQLLGSTGNGAYTSGGVAYDLSPLPPNSLQSDGDPDNASDRNVPMQGLADKVAYLFECLDTFRLVNAYSAIFADDTWTAWISAWAIAGSSGWINVQDGSGHDVSDFFSFGTPAPLLDHRDIIRIAWQLGDVANGGAGNFALRVALKISSVNSNVAFGDLGDADLVLSTAGNTKHQGEAVYQVSAAGAAASITAAGGGNMTLTGVTGMSTASVGDTIVITGAASPTNNGTFPVVTYVSGTSVIVANPSAVAPDANNGAISWRMKDMKFSVHLQVETTSATASSMSASGHHSMAAMQYRTPGPFPWAGLVG